MFPLRACRRGCNGRFLLCLRVSVVAALPSSPLPTAGLARCGRWVCSLACLPVGSTEGRGTSLLPPWGRGEQPTTQPPLCARCAVKAVAKKKKNRNYLSGSQTSVLKPSICGVTGINTSRVKRPLLSALYGGHLPPTRCYVEFCTPAN